jgi:hypothetical protein
MPHELLPTYTRDDK